MLGLLIAAALHPLGVPAGVNADTLTLRNRSYDCCYSPRLRVSRWVAYFYTAAGTAPSGRFRGGFKADPRLDTLGGPAPADYAQASRLDLDRGHQAPDATIKRFGSAARQETYFLSNVTPQYRRLNRGLWREFESAIREWTGKDETTWVVTGPVFLSGRDTQWLGNRRVAVPHGYFCSVMRTRVPGLLTLLVPNRPQGCGWNDAPEFAVSVDSVERLTGLNLYPRLRPADEQKLESAAARAVWPRPGRRAAQR